MWEYLLTKIAQLHSVPDCRIYYFMAQIVLPTLAIIHVFVKHVIRCFMDANSYIIEPSFIGQLERVICSAALVNTWWEPAVRKGFKLHFIVITVIWSSWFISTNYTMDTLVWHIIMANCNTERWVNLTHWGRVKMDAISQTTFWSAFSWIKMYEMRLKFHWSLLLGVQLILFQHWFRWWLGADQTTSHYLAQWWLIYWRI